MAPREPTIATTCEHCGKQFNTSLQNPRRYCSIACEERRLGRVPMDDIRSPDYPLYLMSDPEDLVGKTLVANGLKHVNYSPDWCKNPEDWRDEELVSVDRENEAYVRKDSVVVGTVVDYDGTYTIEHEDIETGEITTRRMKDILVVELIKDETWWVE